MYFSCARELFSFSVRAACLGEILVAGCKILMISHRQVFAHLRRAGTDKRGRVELYQRARSARHHMA
jgi:hypothetical protein